MVLEWYCKKKKRRKVLEKNGGRFVQWEKKHMKFFQRRDYKIYEMNIQFFRKWDEYSICSYDCCRKEFKIISMVRDYDLDHPLRVWTMDHTMNLISVFYIQMYFIFFHFFIVQ